MRGLLRTISQKGSKFSVVIVIWQKAEVKFNFVPFIIQNYIPSRNVYIAHLTLSVIVIRMIKKFVKNDKTDFEVNIEDSLKIFIRFPKGTTAVQMHHIAEAMRCPIVFIPEGCEVIVVNKDGTAKKF